MPGRNGARFTSPIPARGVHRLPALQRPTDVHPLRRDAAAMGRTPRFDLPGIPQHIVQRGHNRLPCYLHDHDRLHDLHLLRDALTSSGVQLHAYVRMDNHVHLLATPLAPGSLSRLMQRFGRQNAGRFNARHGRTGAL